MDEYSVTALNEIATAFIRMDLNLKGHIKKQISFLPLNNPTTSELDTWPQRTDYSKRDDYSDSNSRFSVELTLQRVVYRRA